MGNEQLSWDSVGHTEDVPSSLWSFLASQDCPFLCGSLQYLFSSGMWSAIICRGSRHCTTQPWRSLTRSVSTLRKLLGMRLHSTGWMVWTSSRGGHCGVGFFSSLLNMAADKGIAFWDKVERHQRRKGAHYRESLSCWIMYLAHNRQFNQYKLRKTIYLEALQRLCCY